MFLLFQSDWTSVAKIYGPLGVGCVVAYVLVKVLLNYVKVQHAEHVQTLKAAELDAREERDYMRQLREKEVDKFLDSLKLRDEKMERSINEVVSALRKR